MKIYDNLGTLVAKKDLSIFDFNDQKGVIFSRFTEEEKIKEILYDGFQFYSAQSDMWVGVDKGSCLANVVVMKRDLDSESLLKIKLAKKQPIFDNFEPNFDDSNIESILEKLLMFSKLKSLKSKINREQWEGRVKSLLGFSVNTLGFYASMVKKAAGYGFDFERNKSKNITLLRKFVKDNSTADD